MIKKKITFIAIITATILMSCNDNVHNDEVQKEKKSVQLSEEDLKQYVGEYWVSNDYKVNITLEGGQLKGQITGQPKVDLFAQRKDLFFLKIVDAQLEFTRDSSGKVVKVTMYQGGAMIEAPKMK